MEKTRLQTWIDDHWREKDLPAWVLKQLQELAHEDAQEWREIRETIDRLETSESKVS